MSITYKFVFSAGYYSTGDELNNDQFTTAPLLTKIPEGSSPSAFHMLCILAGSLHKSV